MLTHFPHFPCSISFVLVRKEKQTVGDGGYCDNLIQTLRVKMGRCIIGSLHFLLKGTLLFGGRTSPDPQIHV